MSDRDQVMWNADPLIDEMTGQPRLDDDVSGDEVLGELPAAAKTALGVNHMVGKTLLNFIGLGSIAAPLEDLQAKQGGLPPWATKTMKVGSPDYVVMVSTNGEKKLLPNVLSATVYGGGRFDGTGYVSGQPLGSLYSFGVNEPLRVELSYKPELNLKTKFMEKTKKDDALTNVKMILFLGGDASGNLDAVDAPPPPPSSGGGLMGGGMGGMGGGMGMMGMMKGGGMKIAGLDEDGDEEGAPLEEDSVGWSNSDIAANLFTGGLYSAFHSLDSGPAKYGYGGMAPRKASAAAQVDSDVAAQLAASKANLASLRQQKSAASSQRATGGATFAPSDTFQSRISATRQMFGMPAGGLSPFGTVAPDAATPADAGATPAQDDAAAQAVLGELQALQIIGPDHERRSHAMRKSHRHKKHKHHPEPVQVLGSDEGGSDYLLGCDVLGAPLPPKGKTPRAGFVLRKTAKGTVHTSLVPSQVKFGDHKNTVANARDVGKRAQSIAAKYLKAIAAAPKRPKDTAVHGDDGYYNIISGDDGYYNIISGSDHDCEIVGDDFDGYTNIIGASRAAFNTGTRPSARGTHTKVKMTVAEAKKLAGDLSTTGKKLVKQADAHAKLSTAFVGKKTAGIQAARVISSKASALRTKVHGVDYEQHDVMGAFNEYLDDLGAEALILGYEIAGDDPAAPPVDPAQTAPTDTSSTDTAPGGIAPGSDAEPAPYGVGPPPTLDQVKADAIAAGAKSPGPTDTTVYTSLPQGAVPYDGSQSLAVADRASVRFGTLSYFKPLPGAYGGGQSGYYMNNDGWALFKSSDPSSDDVHTPSADELADLNGWAVQRGFGPILGNPALDDWKNARWDAGGKQMFWFRDTAPDWLTSNEYQTSLSQALTDYNAALTAAKTDAAAQVLSDQLDAKTATQLAKTQGLEDAANQRQMDQEAKQSQHQSELQTTADTQALATKSALQQQQSEAYAAKQQSDSGAYAVQQQSDVEAQSKYEQSRADIEEKHLQAEEDRTVRMAEKEADFLAAHPEAGVPMDDGSGPSSPADDMDVDQATLELHADGGTPEQYQDEADAAALDEA